MENLPTEEEEEKPRVSTKTRKTLTFDTQVMEMNPDSDTQSITSTDISLDRSSPEPKKGGFLQVDGIDVETVWQEKGRVPQAKCYREYSNE